METNNQGANNTSAASVAPIWENLSLDLEVVVPAKPEEVKPDLALDNVVDQNQTIETEPAKAEPAKTEPAEAAKTEPVKEVKEEAPVDGGEFKFTLDDVKDAPTLHQPNTALSFAQELGVTLEKDSFEDLTKVIKENFVNKSEFETYKSNVDQEYVANRFSPEIAAAIHQVELGLPQELIFEPTKHIDEMLQLDDVALVRLKYEQNPQMTSDLIDTQIEEDIANGKIDAQAKILRINLNDNKQVILNERTQLIEKYTQEKQVAAIRQKEQEVNQVKEALGKVSEFLGVPVTKEAINGIVAKYTKGDYDKDLNVPMSKAQLILYREFGEKFSKLAQDKARAQGKAEITAKLSNVPIKSGSGGSRVEQKSTDKQDDSPFANMPVFG